MQGGGVFFSPGDTPLRLPYLISQRNCSYFNFLSYRYSADDLEALEKQCDVFYTKTIAGAIKAAFVEE